MDDWWSRDCQHEVNSPTVVEAELTPPDDVVLSKGTIENNLLTPQSYGRRGNLRQKDMTDAVRRNQSTYRETLI
jgi:hypothetical protein